MKLLIQKDFIAGIMFVVLGLGVAFVSTGYRMGQLNAFGPGFFPFWLGILLALFGSIVTLGAFLSAEREDPVAKWDIKALFLIIASIVLFGALLKTSGLVVALVAIVAVSSLASHEFTWTATIVNAIVLSIISVMLFVYGLGMRLPVWPPFLGS